MNKTKERSNYRSIVYVHYQNIENFNKVIKFFLYSASSGSFNVLPSVLRYCFLLSSHFRSKPQTPKEQVSPVIGLLNSFTVTSPLRLLLPPPCVGSTFTRPEKRISMFSRDGSNVNLTSDLLESTPLKSTPGMIPRSANIRSARRHLIDGVWPSILGTKAVGVGDGGSHLLAAISASEMSVHNALKCEGASGDGEKREVDLESYPFVKRWKKELDLSFQRP